MNITITIELLLAICAGVLATLGPYKVRRQRRDLAEAFRGTKELQERLFKALQENVELEEALIECSDLIDIFEAEEADYRNRSGPDM